jgi:TctA family transporter
MNKIGLLRMLAQEKKMRNLVIGFILLALANIGTDLTIAQVPVTGDLANTVLDIVFEIVQLGILAKLAREGSSYKSG